MQEKCNSIANAMELHLSCTNPSKYLQLQCMTLDIFKDCHPGYSNLKIYSPIKFCCGHMFQWYKKVKSFKSHVGYKISRSHSPEECFIALATGLLLKSNTAVVKWCFVSDHTQTSHHVVHTVTDFHPSQQQPGTSSCQPYHSSRHNAVQL